MAWVISLGRKLIHRLSHLDGPPVEPFLYKNVNTHTGIFNNWTMSCIHVTVQLAWLAKRLQASFQIVKRTSILILTTPESSSGRQDMIYLSQPSVFIFYRCGDGEELAQKM